MSGSLISRNSLLPLALFSTLCVALCPSIPLLTSEAAPARGASHAARPRPGKPEGIFPDLEKVKEDSDVTREAAPPIPSTLRSPKSPLRPWNGRRVGDSGTQGGLVAATIEASSKVIVADRKLANDAALALKGREFLGLWVFELGNALSVITNISPEIPADSKERYGVTGEAGAAFEDCVFGGKLNPNGSVSPPKH